MTTANAEPEAATGSALPAAPSELAPLDVPVRREATGSVDEELLGGLLSGVWTLRLWPEQHPHTVLTGEQRCRMRESEINYVLIFCDWSARPQGTSGGDGLFAVRFAYMFRGASFYAVRVERGQHGMALYDPQERSLEQIIPLDGERSERVRMVFDPSGQRAQVRFSQVDRSLTEVDRDGAMRGELVKREAPLRTAPERATVRGAPIDDSRCELKRTRRDGAPALDVALAGSLVLQLPGPAKHWTVECGTEETRTPFRATRERDGRVLVVTLETANLLPSYPLDPSRYASELGSLEALRGVATFGDFNLDLGEVALPDSQVARMMAIRRPTEEGVLAAVHGLAPRVLAPDTVVVLHVSETADEPSRQTVESVLAALHAMPTASH